MVGPSHFSGADVAMNHSAFVTIDRFRRVTWSFAIVDVVRDSKILGKRAKLFRRCDTGHQTWTTEAKARRLAHFSEALDLDIFPAVTFSRSFVNIEDYALGKKHNAYHIGEFGGIIRSKLLANGYEYMTTNPRALKKYAEIKPKEKPIAWCQDRGFDPTFGGKLSANTSGDFADAYVLANIALDACNGKLAAEFITRGIEP